MKESVINTLRKLKSHIELPEWAYICFVKELNTTLMSQISIDLGFTNFFFKGVPVYKKESEGIMIVEIAKEDAIDSLAAKLYTIELRNEQLRIEIDALREIRYKSWNMPFFQRLKFLFNKRAFFY